MAQLSLQPWYRSYLGIYDTGDATAAFRLVWRFESESVVKKREKDTRRICTIVSRAASLTLRHQLTTWNLEFDAIGCLVNFYKFNYEVEVCIDEIIFFFFDNTRFLNAERYWDDETIGFCYPKSTSARNIWMIFKIKQIIDKSTAFCMNFINTSSSWARADPCHRSFQVF